jgi:hypothetical protein
VVFSLYEEIHLTKNIFGIWKKDLDSLKEQIDIRQKYILKGV